MDTLVAMITSVDASLYTERVISKPQAAELELQEKLTEAKGHEAQGAISVDMIVLTMRQVKLTTASGQYKN